MRLTSTNDHRREIAVAILALFGGSSCWKGGYLGHVGDNGTTSTSGSETIGTTGLESDASSSPLTSSVDSTSMWGDDASTTSGGGTALASEGSTSTESSGSTTTGPGICTPDGDDSRCTLCTKEHCCPEVEQCYAAPDCACVADCVATMGYAALQACRGTCGTNGKQPEEDALGSCVVGNCLGACA